MSFITVAVIGAGGAIAGGLISANAASSAADKQAQATDKAVGASQAQYNQTRSDLAPYRDAGSAALARLSQLIGVGPDRVTPGATLSDDDLQTMSRNPALQGWLTNAGMSPQQWVDAAKLNRDAGQYGTDRASQLEEMKREFQSVGVNGDMTAGLAQTPAPSSTPGEYGSLLRDFSPADLNADPIYKSSLDFATTQGERAINARRAATGSYDSGGALKELGQFDLGAASGLAGDAYNRFSNNKSAKYGMLTGLSGTGLSAAGATSNAGTANSVNLSNLYTGQGNAAAAAGIAGGNAISGGINNASLLYQLSGGGQRTRTSSGTVGEYNMAPGF